MHYCHLYISGVVQNLWQLCTSQTCFTCTLCGWKLSLSYEHVLFPVCLQEVVRAVHCPKRCQKSVTRAITQPSCCSWHPLRSGMLNTLFKKKIRSLKRQCILHQSQCLISQVYRKRSKFSSNSSLVYSSETCYRTSIVKKSCNNRKAKVWPSSGHTQYTEHLLYSCCFLSEMCMQPLSVFAQYLNW